RHLRKRLEGMVVVSQPPSDRQRVFFGARVTLEAASGGTFEYRLNGADEVYQEAGGIIMDAPLARALLGKPLDAEITVALPAGEDKYLIVGRSCATFRPHH